jgi:outer membrane lipoprotein LolB
MKIDHIIRTVVFFFLFSTIALFNGCAIQNPTIVHQSETLTNQLENKAKRIDYLQQLKKWSITGKIAFITDKKRQSFSFRWTVNELNQSQQLDLTTYLGINLLKLKSYSGTHTLVVDGQKFQGTDLEKLIYSSTGLIIPTKAMHGWLKGLEQSKNDVIEYDQKSHLPSRILSLHDQVFWQIDYANYYQLNQVQMAKKLTIKQNDLVIKIMINRWTIL